MKSPQTRREKAMMIISNPIAYKVCMGCDSIVTAAVVLCPSCHGFRFDGSIQNVIQHAKHLGDRDQTSVTSADLL